MELKPCPFCGDVARRAFNIGQYGAFGCVECDLCGAKSKSVKLIGPKQFESEEAFWMQRAWNPAVRNWNRRYNERSQSNDAKRV